MKIAYLTLVHQNPLLLQRAMRVLSTDGCGFFIHVDSKSNLESFSRISGANVSFVERLPVYWAEFSMVQAILRLMKSALESPSGYDYFVLLLGSDYPIRSGGYIQRYLQESGGSEFISLIEIPAPGYPLSKINKVRYPSDKPVQRFVFRALGKVGLAERDFRKSLGDIKAYAGDTSWALSREACSYIMEVVARDPRFEAYFRKTFTSDEMFFHTILGNSPFRLRVRRGLLYRDWSKPGAHPETLTEKHIEYFELQDAVCAEDQFGTGEKLFARKFSDDQLELIDRIDEMIERKESVNLLDGGII